LTPKIEIHRSIKENFQDKYWQFYYQLLDFKELPAAEQKVQKIKLERQFDDLFNLNNS
jgi:hypothetical protein